MKTALALKSHLLGNFLKAEQFTVCNWGNVLFRVRRGSREDMGSTSRSTRVWRGLGVHRKVHNGLGRTRGPQEGPQESGEDQGSPRRSPRVWGGPCEDGRMEAKTHQGFNCGVGKEGRRGAGAAPGVPLQHIFNKPGPAQPKPASSYDLGNITVVIFSQA